MKFDANSLMKFASRILELLTSFGKTPPAGKPSTRPPAGKRPVAQGHRSPQAPGVSGWEEGGYPGDYQGRLRPSYSPGNDGKPDPGEIVWAWVPYEEDHSQGKDRPVLLVGRDGNYLLGLMLTSKDHTNGARRDEDYIDIGTGPWDKQGRPSEVKLDRVLRLRASGIRREGAILPRDRFNAVAAGLAARP